MTAPLADLTRDNLMDVVRSVIRLVPQIEPFLYVVPISVLTDEEWHTKIGGGGTPTACATKDAMYFASSFMSTLPIERQRGLVLHEVLHLARHDQSNQWVDRTLSMQSFALLANIAQDHVIEGLIDDIATASAAGGVRMIEPNYEREQYGPYKGWGWREVYDDLKRKHPSKSGIGGPSGVDEPAPSGQSLEGLASVLKAAAAESEGISQRLAAVGSESGAGSITVVPAAAVIPWQTVLRDMLTSIPAPVNKTWHKIRRRQFGAFGTYAPRRSGHEQALHRVTLFVDTSGSMHATLNDVAGDIMQLLRNVNVQNLCIIYYDVGILKRVDLDTYDIETYEIKTMPSGGGTCVAGAMRELTESEDYAAHPIVVLTDGYDDYDIPAQVAERLGPVVWVSYAQKIYPSVGTALTVANG